MWVALYVVILVAGLAYILHINEFLTGKLPVFDQLAIMILALMGNVYAATKIVEFAVWVRRQAGARDEPSTPENGDQKNSGDT